MPRGRAENELRRMVETIRHEPSYVTGTWVDASFGIYVGWAARKGSFLDGMPLRSERGDLSLVFSGEEFPEPRTDSGLRQRGHVLESGPSSYLVHLAEEDTAFPAGLNGRFHGLLTDSTEGSSRLFNDRYGLHRIYYHESGEAFYFSAEAKAILAVRPPFGGWIAGAWENSYPADAYSKTARFSKGSACCRPLRSGCSATEPLERKGVYFSAREWEDQAPLEPEAYYRELRDVFVRNLPRYFEGREAVGLSLTGGLDTRMIMAWRQVVPQALPCYSFGGMYRDSQDVVIARKVAKACGQTHEIIAVGDDFLSNFPRYAERSVYLTDGCIEVSHSPDLYVNERAAKIAPVRMTGNYGGEVLRGLRAFKPTEAATGLFAKEFLPYLEAARTTYGDVTEGHPLSFAVFRQAPWHHHGLLSLEETQLSLRSPYLDNDFIRTVFRAPKSATIDGDVSLRLIADGDPNLARIRTDRGQSSGKNGLRAHALRNLIDFTIKAEYAYDYGMPQWLAQADRILARLHPERLFLGRHKFYHFRLWYRDFLRGYIQEVLLDSRTLARPYLHRKAVEAMLRAHIRGKRNYTLAIHKVLTLELIHRLFVDQPCAGAAQ